MKSILLALALLLCIEGWNGPAYAVNMQTFNTEVDQTNFLINDGCSGTLIDKEKGYILTAEHCITSQYKIIEREEIDDDGTVQTKKVRVMVPGTVSQISFINSVVAQTNTYVFKVIEYDKERDLALIQTVARLPNHTKQAKIACEEPKRGDAVYVVGNPHGVLYTSMVKGIVSSNHRNYRMLGINDQGEHRLTQISAGVIGGNSGGSVYNDDGELVGVPVRGSRMNEILGFAVPLGEIKEFLERPKKRSVDPIDLTYLWDHCK